MNVLGALTTVFNGAPTHLGHSGAHAILGSGWLAMQDLAMVSFINTLMSKETSIHPILLRYQ